MSRVRGIQGCGGSRPHGAGGFESLFLQPSFDIGINKRRPWLSAPRSFPGEFLFLLQAIGLFARLMTRVGDPRLRREYRRRLGRFLKVHRRPGLALFYLFHMAMHYHAYQLAKQVANPEMQLINSY